MCFFNFYVGQIQIFLNTHVCLLDESTFLKDIQTVIFLWILVMLIF